jgi:RNA recognition motif-containing protein
MGKNLYIGNLAEAVTETDLKTNFEQAGSVVSVNIIKDRYTGLSRGFGFIEMGTEEEAKEAIKRFDNGELLGNAIKVNEAKPKPDSSNRRPGGLRNGGDGRGGGPKPGRGWRF